MKKTALLAAAAALVAASPAAAQGSLGLNYASSDLGGAGDFDALSVDGAVGFGSGAWGAQLDAALGNLDFPTGDSDYATLGGHLWYGGQGWRLGGVVTYTNIDEAPDSEIAYGVEGTYDVGESAVLLGSITLGDIDDADLFNWDFGGNYYFTPNLRVGGAIGGGTIETGGPELDTETYGISAEYQPWTTPVSFTLGWSTYDIESAVSSDTWTIGARWNFGGGTLRERDNATPFDTNTGYLNRLYGIY